MTAAGARGRLAFRSLVATSALVVCGCASRPIDGTLPAGDAGAVDGQSDAGPAPDAGPPSDAGPPRSHVIAVTTTAVVDADDGQCSLSEAIAASNGHTSVAGDDCPAGTGNDVITLPAGNFDIRQTLELTESVELRGAGMGKTTLSFGGAALQCGVRLAVTGKTVWLTGLTLQPTVTGTLPPALTGVCVTAGVVRVRHARVTGFTAGGLRAEAPDGIEAKLEVFDALVDGNSNAGDGGGIAFIGAGAWITVHESAIVNNTSGGMGGGVFVSGGMNANYIINSTLSGNVARRGGGVAAVIRDQTYMGLVGTTVVYNHALEVGGGLHIQASPTGAGHALATGAIIAANVADGDAAQANLNADWEAGFSCTFSLFYLAGLARQPPNFIDSCLYDVPDPKLGPLMDMGGADHLPMHALLPGSPAIDAITEEFSTEQLEQRDSWSNEAGDPPLGTGPDETPPWTLFGRLFEGNPRADIGAFEFNPRWETELLPVAQILANGHFVTTAPAGFSHGAGTRLAAYAGAFFAYQVPVPQAGRYAIAVRTLTRSDAGRWELSVAEAITGDYEILSGGGIQDGYSAADGWQTLELGTVDFSSAGQKFFRFTLVGRNAASSGDNVYLDYLTVTKQ